MNRIRIHLILFSLLMTGIVCYSQSPNLISYQTVIRNGNNELVSNTTIGVRISILGGPEANVLVYQEEHTVKTNINGLAYLTIGNGKILNGLINSIDWSKGPYFIKAETDPTGGKNYTIVVLSQMLSVPYAIYSSTAERITGTLPEKDPLFNGSIAKGITAIDTSYWNKKLNTKDTIGMLEDYLKKESFPKNTENGDILFYFGNKWVNLAKGKNGQVLTLIEGVPKWSGPAYPTLTTIPISNITSTTANSGGNISSDGGDTIFSRGLVWDTITGPTLSLMTKTSAGDGSGTFTSVLSSLRPSTKYFVRAFATNRAGTTYGNEITFTTSAPVVAPIVSTSEVKNITSISAMSGGNISSNDSKSITTRGVVWSTSPLPTITLNTKTNDGSGTGSFSSLLLDLSLNTKYYIRAYATYSSGTSYGNEYSFTTTNSPIVTDIDGNTYNTVKIGTQVWMSENLKTTKYRGGSPIPEFTCGGCHSAPGYGNLFYGVWSYYHDNEANNVQCGKLYNWYSIQGDTICPVGWHVPSNSEWTTLTNYLGGGSIAAGKLVSYEIGFKALSCGLRADYGIFYNYGTHFWTATEAPGGNFAYSRYILNGTIESDDPPKSHGQSIRCIKN